MKSKKLKGIIAVLGATTIVVGSLVGCGDKSEEQQQDNKQSQIETKIDDSENKIASNDINNNDPKNDNGTTSNNDVLKNSRSDIKDLFTKIDEVRSGKNIDLTSKGNKSIYNSKIENKKDDDKKEEKNNNIERPIISKPIVEKPVVEKPVIKPVVEKPVVEKPVIKPVVEKPIIKPVEEKPSKPVVEKPTKPIEPTKPSEKPKDKPIKPVEKPKEEEKVIAVAYVNVDILNVREGEGIDFKDIGELKKGTKVEIVKKGEEWNKIRYEKGYGYVSNKYLSDKPIEENPVENPTKPSEPSKPSEKPKEKPSKPVKKTHKEQNGLAGQIAKTQIAKQTNQIILVVGNKLSLWNKSNGKWNESLIAGDRLGYGGLTSNKHEGDGATPIGVYPILYGFGFGSNPGTSLEYKRITNNSYFVDDVHSKYYNQWYDGKGQKGEHMIDHPQYKYGMVIGYNTSHTKGKGSAIFLHCNGRGSTAGCISVSEGNMLRLLKSTHEGAYIIITSSESNLKYY